MFEVRVESVFCAAHALVIGGVREPVHGHNWHVTVAVAGPALDADGLLVDFHAVEKALAELLRPMHNNDLHRVPPFDRVNPTAENVAMHIGRSMRDRVDALPMSTQPRPRVVRAEVTEAPGCVAVWRAE